MQLAKKIKGMEVSWGQGLAFATANEFQMMEGSMKAPEGADAVNVTVVDQIFDLVYSGTNQVLSFFNFISVWSLYHW